MMMPHHTAATWTIGLVVVSLLLGSVVSWLVWKALHSFTISTARSKRWPFEEADAEKIPFYAFLAGILERLFFTILVAFGGAAIAPALVLWMIAKMTTGWNRITKPGVFYRMLAFSGLISSLISMIFAVLGGLIANGSIPLFTLWE
jgi:hypothetical protein